MNGKARLRTIYLRRGGGGGGGLLKKVPNDIFSSTELHCFRKETHLHLYIVRISVDLTTWYYIIFMIFFISGIYDILWIRNQQCSIVRRGLIIRSQTSRSFGGEYIDSVILSALNMYLCKYISHALSKGITARIKKY